MSTPGPKLQANIRDTKLTYRFGLIIYVATLSNKAD